MGSKRVVIIAGHYFHSVKYYRLSVLGRQSVSKNSLLQDGKGLNLYCYDGLKYSSNYQKLLCMTDQGAHTHTHTKSCHLLRHLSSTAIQMFSCRQMFRHIQHPYRPTNILVCLSSHFIARPAQRNHMEHFKQHDSSVPRSCSCPAELDPGLPQSESFR